MQRLAAALILFFAFPVGLALAQDDDELARGLNVEFTAGGRTVSESVESVSFDWQSASPDPRLPAGPFEATWSGMLLIQQPGKHRFYAYVDGQVEVRLANEVVFAGQSTKPQWIEGKDVNPELGLQPFEVTYRKTGPTARVHLFWSSETFPLEPLPSQFLFREPPNAKSATYEVGRSSFARSRCVSCHQRDNAEPAFVAPDLSRSVAHTELNWIVDKLQNRLDGDMPDFGLTLDESIDVATFLQSQTREVSLENVSKPEKNRDDAKDVDEGHTLVRSLGCVACHSIKSAGINTNSAVGAGDLSSIGLKRSAEWIFTWLKSPEKLNATHRMPVFTLSTNERRQLALGLSSLRAENPNRVNTPQSDKPSDPLRKEQIARGRALVNSAGCASCHAIDGIEKPKRTNLADLSKTVRDWDASCLSKTPDRTNWQPAFAKLETDSIREFVNGSTGQLALQSAFDRGRRLMQTLGCSDCHPRGSSSGLGSVAAKISLDHKPLRGLAPGLVPPSLTAVGDKLLHDALLKSIHGEQTVRKPWLSVRMPKFAHSKKDASAIVAYLVGQDRIPDDAPGVKSISTEKVDDQGLLIGQALVGPKGFSCIACHQVGEYEPRNTALGTKGSDLLAMGKRMRPAFFLRWTRSPLRIVPGLEMPGYSKPAKGALGDDVDRQLNLLWHALNDARFEAPTNPASVEQYFVVERGPARIVRDVFENPKENGGGYVARAFAVGFENQQNALFDLDTLTLRAWTFGDFARQRTSGKSWYWDMAGSYVMTGFAKESDYALVSKQPGGKPVAPLRSAGTVGKLVSYKPAGYGVEFVYRMNFEIDGKKRTIEIQEVLSPLEQRASNGWSRSISATSIPAGYDVQITQPIVSESNTLGRPEIRRGDSTAAADAFKPTFEAARSTRLVASDGKVSGRIEYLSRLQAPALQVELKPLEAPAAQKVTSVPGFEGWRLPLPGSIMPTATTTLPDGTLAFTSLKGHVYLAKDTDGDGLEDSLTLFEEGLAAPYGILADGDSILVSHKPEVIRLRDTDGDGRADERSVVASGWGYNDNYHDWSCSLIRDSKGNMYVGLGSDYSQPGRPKEHSLWRGKVVQISPSGETRPFAHGFRFPTGLAIDEQDRLFATDNQGVQNCFNELNYLQDGVHYGVPSLHEQDLKVAAVKPAIQVPHPWTRSVNGIVFLPPDFADESLRGHGIGCEYNGKVLVRWTSHEVDGQLQGAVFFLSRPEYPIDDENFLGPICTHVSQSGEVYVGSIHDSGWLGGLNTGSIVKLKPSKRTQNGIRDIQATREGFRLDFFQPVDATLASDPSQYSLSGYTRVWEGSYATPDSGRYEAQVTNAVVSQDRKSVLLTIDRRQEDFVYEINTKLKDGEQPFWPATGHYSLHRNPK